MFSVVLGQQGTSPHWLALAGPLLLAGAGLGLFIAPLQTVILSGVKQENAGSASGLLPTFQQLGGSVGLAALGVVFFTLIGNQAPRAVDQVRPALVGQLDAIGLPAAAQQPLLTSFAECSARRLASTDPAVAPPGCAPPTAAPGSPQARAGAALAVAGREVGGQSFLASMQRTLWTMSALLAVVMGLSLLLPRRTAGHRASARPD